MNSFCAWYSFRMSFCSVPPSARPLDAGRFGVRDVHREDHRGRTVDRHRRGDRAEVDAAVEVLDVGERVDRDAALADLAERELVVGVAAHQRRQVERGRQPVAARRRAARGTGGSCRARCRSRRTCASSRASSGTSTRTGHACTGTGPGTRRRRARRPASTGTPDIVVKSASRATVASNASRHSSRRVTASGYKPTPTARDLVTPWSRPAV